jgi:hypothetical protein
MDRVRARKLTSGARIVRLTVWREADTQPAEAFVDEPGHRIAGHAVEIVRGVGIRRDQEAGVAEVGLGQRPGKLRYAKTTRAVCEDDCTPQRNSQPSQIHAWNGCRPAVRCWRRLGNLRPDRKSAVGATHEACWLGGASRR